MVSETPVVGFSNYDDPKAKAETKDLGVKAYLLKTDYTPSKIIEKIKEYLSKGEKKGEGTGFTKEEARANAWEDLKKKK